MKFRWSVFAAILGFIFLFSSAVRAQEFAAVTGVVTDKTGGAVSGVEVSLDNDSVGLHVKTETNDLGVYQFLRLAPGPGYNLTFAKQGFKKFSLSDVYLGVSTVSTHNATLEVGEISQTVEVKETSEATLDTTDASIGNVFDTTLLHTLPIQFRDSPAALLGLQPGVVLSGGNDPSGNREGSVTGARADQGNITIDGIDANDQATGQAFATVGNAPVDAIQEFRGITANPLADQGRSSGAEIQLTTKGGTNKFHGNLYEYHRNTIFAANTFFNNANGVPRAALIRNQFGGSLGGAVKKDRLFFFFNYEGRRDASQDNISRTVPLDHVLMGQLAYINNGPGCTAASRIDTQPACISFTPATGPNSLAGIDPAGTGASTALLTFLNSRYPHANDLIDGDGVNTGVLRFNAPFSLANNTYVTRIDYNITSKQKLFGRFNIVRSSQTDDVNFQVVEFPGDPAPAHQITARDYSFAIGHTWTISSTKINQLTVGVSDSRLGFPSLVKQGFPDTYTFGPYSAPFSSLQSQFRTVPVPTFRDDFNYIHGKHSLQMGGSFKPQHQTSTQINDFNFLTLGLGGNTLSLDSPTRAALGLPGVRPSDILLDPAAFAEWDANFPFILGRFASDDTNFNYTKTGTSENPGTGKTRNYRYFEYEFYGQDQWRVTNNLTFTYGLRWQYYSVPYETGGLQSVPTVDFNQFFNTRVANSLAGISGPNAAPLVQYVLGGSANSHAPSIYNPTYRNFSPRLALAYNPGFKGGALGSIFGDRKTTIRLGGTIDYDRVNANTINFIQDQVSYLFNNSVNTPFGGGDPAVTLATDPRFQGIGTLPVTNVAPPITTPFTPFVDPGTGYPLGNAQGQFNYTIEKNFRTPYSYVYTLGFQRELPGNFILEADYVGRLGRKLFAQSDGAQLVDFIDPTSKQGLVDAFNQLSAQVRAGVPGAQITTQPFFENQMNAAIQTNFGIPNCQAFVAAVFGPATAAAFPTCTRLVRGLDRTLLQRGDLTDTLQALYGFFPGPFGGLLPPNVGLAGQFSVNSYISNAGSSNYNALLLTLRKRLTAGLQFDFNYTLGHSIDNLSTVTNTVIGGLVCDVRNLRVCRGNSDFDVKHAISANGVYDLPFGKGRQFGSHVSGWVNQIIGGWQFGAIATFHTGFAFSTSTDAFPVNFFVNSPAILTGSSGAIKTNIHTDSTGKIQLFADPTAAQAAFSFTNGGQVGSRNTLRGPGYWNFDTSVSKSFNLPWSESHKLQFRWESYNAFNHTTFADPSADKNGGTFGQITATAGGNRVMQFALRYDF